MTTFRLSYLLAVAPLFIGCANAPPDAGENTEERSDAVSSKTVSVSGSGVHYFDNVIVHSVQPTATGIIQTSTESVDLEGDLDGRILYQPITTIDFVAGTLVNTGEQVFSGTVLGSAPVMIHDDSFRFDVNLNTGETIGEVHLDDPLTGPKITCDLAVVGTGMTPEGNALFDYTGTCKIKK